MINEKNTPEAGKVNCCGTCECNGCSCGCAGNGCQCQATNCQCGCSAPRE